MIDEFQDIDAIQYELMEVLCGYHKNLFIVGDPDQTIYTCEVRMCAICWTSTNGSPERRPFDDGQLPLHAGDSHRGQYPH